MISNGTRMRSPRGAKVKWFLRGDEIVSLCQRYKIRQVRDFCWFSLDADGVQVADLYPSAAAAMIAAEGLR